MSDDTHRAKSVLTVVICLGLVILAVLIFAVSAQGAARFLTTPIGYAPVSPHQEARQAVQDWIPTPPPVKAALRSPTRLPAAAPAKLSGGCYAVPGGPPASVIHRESRGNPKARNPRSGAAGCYQFMKGTWDNYKGYSTADQAPVEVQNEKAREVWSSKNGPCHWRATTEEC